MNEINEKLEKLKDLAKQLANEIALLTDLVNSKKADEPTDSIFGFSPRIGAELPDELSDEEYDEKHKQQELRERDEKNKNSVLYAFLTDKERMQELRSLAPIDALFMIFFHVGEPLKRAQWSGGMEAVGYSHQTATRARAEMISMGLLKGHYGTYQLTELQHYYHLTLLIRLGHIRADEQQEELEEFKRTYGKKFEH